MGSINRTHQLFGVAHVEPKLLLFKVAGNVCGSQYVVQIIHMEGTYFDAKLAELAHRLQRLFFALGLAKGHVPRAIYGRSLEC